MAYISVKGIKIFTAVFPSNRGITVLVFNRTACTNSPFTTYDTFGDSTAASRLVTYLNSIEPGYVILGVTSDSADTYLAAAKPALKSLGVDVDTLAYRDKFLFIIEKGSNAPIEVQRSAAGEPHIECEHEFI
jgi:hypothetical protein